MASLKVAAIFWLKATPVSALTGLVELTVGEVTDGGDVIPTLFSQQPVIEMTSSSGISHLE
jgi:hypothetical protein